MNLSAANRLINDPDFQELIADLRKELAGDFSRTKSTEVQALVHVRLKMECLDDLESKLKSLARDYARQGKTGVV